MPLDGRQIELLADLLDREWDLTTLTLFVKDELDVDLANLAPDGSFRQRAMALLLALGANRPPRDTELLERLRRVDNPALRAMAAQLLAPGFFRPDRDRLEAIVLGRAPFVARPSLRHALQAFTAPTEYTTRVLVVRGAVPGGKSYTWEFLRHLARGVGATPLRLRLETTDYSPRRFVEQVFALLRLPSGELPTMVDDPQRAHVGPLVNVFKGQIAALRERFWLVIDDLNDPTVTDEIRETAYALARAVEESRPPELWLALLGYNHPISEPDLRYIAQDDAVFPDAAGLAQHFAVLAGLAAPPPWAQQLADALVVSHPSPLSKAAMIRIAADVERIGEQVQRGELP